MGQTVSSGNTVVLTSGMTDIGDVLYGGEIIQTGAVASGSILETSRGYQAVSSGGIVDGSILVAGPANAQNNITVYSSGLASDTSVEGGYL